MSHLKQIPGEPSASVVAAVGAPTGNVGIVLSGTPSWGASRAPLWMLTISVAVAAADLTAWIAMPGGVAGSGVDDTWGKFQDLRDTFPLGVIGAAVPVGVYHFVISDMGIASRFAVQASAGTVTYTLTPILSSARGN